jgi:hypothetical protein
MGLLIKLQDGDTQLKSLKFGKDRPNGGDSGQPFVQKSIEGKQGEFSQLDNDFLWRGGIRAPLAAAQDTSRLTQFLFNIKSPDGFLFTTKQNLLSRTGTKTEASKGLAYGNSTVNEGIYNPLSTIAQAGVNYLGFHYNKQGIDPTGNFPNLGIITYQEALRDQSVENFQETNRLVKLNNLLVANDNNTTEFNGVKKYSLNGPGESIILSYSGGPGSQIGTGTTYIKYATDNKGVAPLKTGVNLPESGKPLDQIEQDKFQLPIGASSAFNNASIQQVPILSNEQTNGLANIPGYNSYEYNFSNDVYQSGSLTPVVGIDSYLTRSQAIIERSSENAVYVSPINNLLRAAGIGTTPGVDGSGRQIVVDPVYDTTLGHFIAVGAKDSGDTSPGAILGQYSSENTLFNDNLNQKYTTSPKDHKKGYLANLDKNSGYYYDPQGKLSYVLNQYPRGIAPDFRKTSRKVRGFNDTPEGEFTNYDKITESSDYIGANAKLIDKIYYGSNSQKRTSAPINNGNDIIPFRINIVNPLAPNSKSTPLNFRAYIDDFSDDYSADWTSQTYMGRAEKFYRYTGFDRSINLSFTIIADSENNHSIMYEQLNTLAASLAPTYTSAGYMAGNLHQITLGNYLVNQWGVLTGLSYTPDDDSPWGVKSGMQLPFYIKVTGLKFNVIHNFRPESYFNKPHKYIAQTADTNG